MVHPAVPTSRTPSTVPIERHTVARRVPGGRPTVRVSELASPPPAVVRIFGDRVREKIQAGGIVAYSDRVKLFRLARVLGIGRFDASLIIAAVQHRHGEPHRRETIVVPAGGRGIVTSRAGLRLRSVLGVVLLVQSAIVLAGWVLLAH